MLGDVGSGLREEVTWMKITVEIDAATLIWLVLNILAFSAIRERRLGVASGYRQPKVEAAYTPGAPIRAPLSLYAHCSPIPNFDSTGLSNVTRIARQPI
jgi:hypothetical protein